MKVFMATDILVSLPACWEEVDENSFPIKSQYLSELRSLGLIAVNDGKSIQRTELGEAFLEVALQEEDMASELANPAIPFYADLEDAVKVFKQMRKDKERLDNSRCKDMMEASAEFNDELDKVEKKCSCNKNRCSKMCAKKAKSMHKEFLKDLPFLNDLLNNAEGNIQGFFVFGDNDEDDDD